MVDDGQKSRYGYRISRVNCWDAFNPSSDDFDFPGYNSRLKIPPRELRAESSHTSNRKSLDKNLVLF
jgi:hypothetical protein